MANGSCLCGAVRWRVETPFERMTHCHCSMCRKAHGAAFATYATVAEDRFEWLSGEGEITRYESSPGFHRGFCSRCGSVVPDRANGMVFTPAGCLDDDSGVRPSAHIFFADRVPWHLVEDDLPRSDAYGADVDLPVIARQQSAAATPGVLRGSCLCGAVAFEVTGPLKGAHNCHCSRCRKGRAAAHASNAFTSIDGARFVRGEDHVVTYKVPEARFFAVAFCDTCGSGVLRHDPVRGIAVIPMGALDDDPGRGADDHIFVGSKAPWYEITDDLPQFEEGAS